MRFNRDGDAGRNACSEAEEEPEAKAVADSEDDGVGDGASEESERAVLTAQQIIGEIEAAEHIQAGAGDADGRDCVVVHFVDCRGKPFGMGGQGFRENSLARCF